MYLTPPHLALTGQERIRPTSLPFSCFVPTSSRLSHPLQILQPCRWSCECASRSVPSRSISTSFERLALSPLASHTCTHTHSPSPAVERLTPANPPPPTRSLAYPYLGVPLVLFPISLSTLTRGPYVCDIKGKRELSFGVAKDRRTAP